MIQPHQAASAHQRRRSRGDTPLHLRRVILDRAAKGETPTHIARALGLHRETVRRIVRSGRAEPSRTVTPPADVEAICEAAAATPKAMVVAAATGFHPEKVRRVLRARGIEPASSRNEPGTAETARITKIYAEAQSIRLAATLAGRSEWMVRRIATEAGILRAPTRKGVPGEPLAPRLSAVGEPTVLPPGALPAPTDAEPGEIDHREVCADFLADLRRVHRNPASCPSLVEVDLRTIVGAENHHVMVPPRDLTAILCGDPPAPAVRFEAPPPPTRFPGVTLARVSL